MQTPAIQTQLLDLPLVFKPGDATFNAVMNAFLAGLNAMGGSAEALAKQLTLAASTGNWLSFWGLFLGLIRQSGESDAQFLNRIQQSLLGWTSTPAGIGKFAKSISGVPITVSENFASPSWSLTFGGPLQAGALNNLFAGLSRIRPAGVPGFPFNVIAGGMFLNTNLFLGMSQAVGAYLEASSQSFYPVAAPNTNDFIENIPASYLQFPTQFQT